MTTARIRQAQALISSCDPFEDQRPARAARSKPTSDDIVLAGAKGIYGVLTRTEDPAEIDRKWETKAKPLAKARLLIESAACLRAAGAVR